MMSRLGGGLAFTYGVVVYVAFLAVFVYAIGFVEDAGVVKGVDHGGTVTDHLTISALVVNLLLLGAFAIQHSVMARPAFKAWWTRVVPVAVERSTYVAAATGLLALLIWQWRPITATVWELPDGAWTAAAYAVSLAGWGLVLFTTFLINHFDLFGLRQVFAALRRRRLPPYRFVTPLLYRVVRHPLYLGFLIAFWVTPRMSVGHLIFSLATTGFILVAVRLEEHDLVEVFGSEYEDYQHRVPMIVPGTR